MFKKSSVLDLFLATVFFAVAYAFYWFCFQIYPTLKPTGGAGVMYWASLVLMIGSILHGLAFTYRAFTGKRLLGLRIIG